ncbi:hypothetical protein [Georgenia deserti]|uniref:DUF2267 domain-containing protein n=1 Tax=Georgenia deserti TaxID=2093781 RepID=A0ABW4L4K8_9MICO
MRLSLLAESELPLRILSDLAPRFEQEFAEKFDDGEWSIRVGKESIPLDTDGRVPIDSEAAALQRRWDSDLIVYVTDLPRFVDGEPLVADLSGECTVALISAPSQGLALRRRLHDTVVRAVSALAERNGDVFRARNRRRDVLQPTRRSMETDQGDQLFAITGARGYARLLIGIVRANRPWRLAPALSSASAAAAATGAFGIFYSSIWTMAAAASPARMLLVMLLAIAVMSAWLIGYNGLWERGRPRRESVLRNTGMLATVASAVTIMYALLYVAILVGAVAVIDPQYMSQQLQGESASIGNYLSLAWMSSSMGMVAGALGSSWDENSDVREAIFGRRGYQRRAQTSGWEVSDRLQDG